MKLYKQWLDDKRGIRSIAQELDISPNSVYTVLAKCAKQEYLNDKQRWH